MRYTPRFPDGVVWLTKLVVAVVILSTAVAAQAGIQSPDVPVEQVTLQLKWRHGFQFAGYYAAIAHGYYRDAGFEVRLVEATPGLDVVKEVVEGRAQYGAGTTGLLLRRNEGQPVVVLAAIYQHSPLVLVVRRDAGVSNLHDLHNKAIMIEPEAAELRAYLKDEGLDPRTTHLVPHSFNPQDFLSGRVAAYAAYSTSEPYLFRQAGVDFQIFTPRTGGIDFYGDNLFTTEQEIAQRPERVRAFREASLRGWEYAMAHRDEMIDLILRDYTQERTRDKLHFEAEQTAELMNPGLIEAGHMNPGRWRHIADTYSRLGMLPKDFDLTGFIYNPDPHPDYTWVYWALAGAGVLLIAVLGWALPLYLLNRRLRAADEAKTQYLAFLTHEIRTPLNGLVGVMTLMKDGELPPDQEQNVQLLDQSTRSLVKLVDNVLDCSRLEAGRMTVELQPVEVGSFMRELMALYVQTAGAKGLNLRQEIAAGVSPVVTTDPLRLRQILANLVSNAIKFTTTGSVEIEVEPGQGGRLRFHVRDTGPGISTEQMANLFQPYGQADKTIARRFGGSGLGLCISRDLARLLGGDVSVQSELGVGTTFTVEIEAEPVATT